MASTPGAQKFERSDAELAEVKARLEAQEAAHRALVQEKKELERALNEKIGRLQDALADQRAQNARLATQVEYSNEKEKLLMVTE